MATSENFKDFVLENLANALDGCGFSFSVKKMFGEYCIYLCEDSAPLNPPKPLALICDDTLFFKQFKELSKICESCERGFPYPGAKEAYILDVESHALLREVVLTLAPILPTPKPKKPKQSKSKIPKRSNSAK